MGLGCRGDGARPLFSIAELGDRGRVAHELGTPVDAASIRVDYALYRELDRADLPGLSVLADGRYLLCLAQCPVEIVGLGTPL